MTGWLDRLPAALRHFLFTVTGLAALALLNWVSTDYLNWNLPLPVVGIIAAVLPVTTAFVTTWSQQYGRKGSVEEPPAE